jgi:hypothetical protein
MRVLTTIFLAFPEQKDAQNSATEPVADPCDAVEPSVELVSFFEGKNRVVVIKDSEG